MPFTEICIYQVKPQKVEERAKGTGSLCAADGTLVDVAEGLEETVFRDICRDKVREVLRNLPAEDARLIELLYFLEVTVTDAYFNIFRKTVFTE